MSLPHWLILVGGIVALLASSTDPRRFVLVVIFTLPFNGVFVEVGQRLELFKVASIIALPVATLQLPRLLKVGAFGGFGFFALWTLCITFLTLWFPPSYLNFEGDGLRSIGLRVAIQLTLLLSRVVLAGLCIMSLRTPKDVLTAVRVWVAATTLLAAHGLLEEIAYFMGFNIGGVYYDGLLNGSPTHLAHSVSGLVFKRVGSFAHEPKMLARWLIPSLVILLCDAGKGNWLTRTRFRSEVLVVIHFAALVFTFSTSGYLVFLASTAISFLTIGGSAKVTWKYGIFSAAVAMFAGLCGLGVNSILQSVVAEKFARYDGFIQGGSDGPATAFLIEYPWAAIWGSGLATQGFYLPEFISTNFEFVYENVMDRGVGGFGVESGWLSLLVDTGCIGIAAIIFLVISRWSCSTRMLQRCASLPKTDDVCGVLMLTRCFLEACLIGMIAYPYEGVGLLALSVGMASAAIASTSRHCKESTPPTLPSFGRSINPSSARRTTT